jgi:hypothetical protein
VRFRTSLRPALQSIRFKQDRQTLQGPQRSNVRRKKREAIWQKASRRAGHDRVADRKIIKNNRSSYLAREGLHQEVLPGLSGISHSQLPAAPSSIASANRHLGPYDPRGVRVRRPMRTVHTLHLASRRTSSKVSNSFLASRSPGAPPSSAGNPCGQRGLGSRNLGPLTQTWRSSRRPLAS